MRDYQSLFAGKKITVLGLGLLGRGVGDVEFLAKCGAQILVTDKKTEKELAESVKKLKPYSNVSFKLGEHDEKDFVSCDLVIKGAKTPMDSPEIAAARKAGIEVVMSTALFAKYAMDAGATIVGVTGTRGKSTVAHMIHHVLIRANMEYHMPSSLGRNESKLSSRTLASRHKKVVLGGNVRGVSTLALLPEVQSGDIAVLELDSWQLQGFGDLKISPHISIFTNLMPDHQDYYTNMDEYFADKANIFRYQKPTDFIFVGDSIANQVRKAKPCGQVAVPPPIPVDWKLKIIGEHNRENAAFAVVALMALDFSEKEIREGIESFEGVEGRLQFVSEKDGVKIYNDNNSTAPEATIAALRALRGDITLIVGGSEKDLELDKLVLEIQKSVSRVILLVHPHYQGSARLAEVLTKAGVFYESEDSLESAFKNAVENTKSGNILFSPAFASFGMFQNEYERNDQFIALVRKFDIS